MIQSWFEESLKAISPRLFLWDNLGRGGIDIWLGKPHHRGDPHGYVFFVPYHRQDQSMVRSFYEGNTWNEQAYATEQAKDEAYHDSIRMGRQKVEKDRRDQDVEDMLDRATVGYGGKVNRAAANKDLVKDWDRRCAEPDRR